MQSKLPQLVVKPRIQTSQQCHRVVVALIIRNVSSQSRHANHVARTCVIAGHLLVRPETRCSPLKKKYLVSIMKVYVALRCMDDSFN